MKILHILNSGSYSGAENVVITIINQMKKRNIDCVYLSLDGSIRKVLKKENIPFYSVDKISVVNIRKALNDIHPDIIHAHDFTASIISSLCFTKVPIISHLHSNPPWILKKCVYSYVYLLSSVFFRKVLTVSDSVENEYIFSKYIKNKIKCIGNPIDISLIQKKAQEYTIDDKYDLIFIGRITEPKNPMLLLEIFEEIQRKKKNIKIAVVGTGRMEHILKKEIEKRKINNNVKLYGFVENPYPILQNSKILCVPSKWEGFCLVAIEALALSKPVVCSGVGGLSSFINEENGKICNFNVDEYVNEIYKLCIDRMYYEKKSKNAIRDSNKMDNIKTYIDYLETLYVTYRNKV